MGLSRMFIEALKKIDLALWVENYVNYFHVNDVAFCHLICHGLCHQQAFYAAIER